MKSFRWASNFVNQPDAEGGFAEDVLSRQGEKDAPRHRTKFISAFER